MFGKIKAIVSDRAFGFIACDVGGPDIFFHKRHVRGLVFENLKPGERVEFEFEETSKGKSATFVQAENQ